MKTKRQYHTPAFCVITYPSRPLLGTGSAHAFAATYMRDPGIIDEKEDEELDAAGEQ